VVQENSLRSAFRATSGDGRANKKTMAKQKRLDDDEIRRKCLGYIYDAEESHRSSGQKSRAQQNQDFFRGGTHQWSEEEYNIYKSKGVEPVTINRCKPIIRSAMGLYDQQKQAVEVLPRKNASVHAAAVWSELLKHTQDCSYVDYVYPAAFLRGLIDTESYLGIDIDKTRNPSGQAVIEAYPLEDVDVDATTKRYDLNDKREPAKFVIVKKWLDRDELRAKYGDDVIDVYNKNYGISGIDEHAEKLVDNLYDSDGSVEGTAIYEDEALKTKYRQRVRYVYWREVKAGLAVFDNQTGKTKTITDKKQITRIKATAKESKRFTTNYKTVYILHKTVMLGGVMLEDIIAPLGEGFSNIPVYRFAAFWDLGYAQGVLDDIISLNREENIHRTQEIKILNQTANSGFMVGKAPPKARRELEDYGSVDGVVIDISKFGGVVEKITPNFPPQGLFMGAQQFELDSKRVSGFDDATMGYETGKTESGKAISLKKQSNASGATMIFINFYYTLTLLGNDLLRIIRENNIYTDEEIKAIVERSSLLDEKYLTEVGNDFIAQIGTDLPRPSIPQFNPEVLNMVRPEDQQRVRGTIKLGAEAAMMYAQKYPQLKKTWDDVIKLQATDLLIQEIRSADTVEYGIKVTVAPTAPTERLSRRLEMEQLMKHYGNLVPPDIFLDSTDLPNKDEIKAKLQQAQQQMQQQQQPVVAG